MDTIAPSHHGISKGVGLYGTVQSSISGPRQIEPCAVCKEVFKFILQVCDGDAWADCRENLAKQYQENLRQGGKRYREASSICEICNLFHEAFESSQDVYGIARSETKPVVLTVDRLRQFLIRADPDFTDGERAFQYVSMTLLNGARHFFRLIRINGYAPLVIGRQPSAEVELGFASTWISDCQRLHAECGSAEPFQLPSRLIYVGGDTEPRLVETSGKIGTFVALSHCWGAEQTLVTNRANMEAHMKCIPLMDMPRTYRDAVFITRKLGYDYLWIDSMCIVQGDSGDWHTECARMDQTFANAALTIAAEDAANTLAGILHRRSMTGRSAREFAIEPENAESELVLRIEKVDRSSSGSGPELEYDVPSILKRRAWALQELLLSRRVLQFRSDRVSFICNRHLRSEILHHPVLYASRLPTIPVLGVSVPKNILIGAAQDFHGVWIEVVANVSRRFLTYEGDKLPSIAGVAKLLQGRHGNSYLAGLWQEDLNRQVAWYVDTRFKKHSRNPAFKELPSWTWASTDYPVEGFWNRRLRKQISYSFKFISAESSATGDDVFSNPCLRSLILCGVMLDVEGALITRPVLYRFTDTSSPRQFRASLHLDTPIQASAVGQHTLACIRPTKLSLFLLGHDRNLLDGSNTLTRRKCSGSWAALALQRVQETTDTFRRIGLVKYKYYDVSNLVSLSEDERNSKLEELEENREIVKRILGREKCVIKLI